MIYHMCTYNHIHTHTCIYMCYFCLCHSYYNRLSFFLLLPFPMPLLRFYGHFPMSWGVFEQRQLLRVCKMGPRGVERAANWAPCEHTGWQQGGWWWQTASPLACAYREMDSWLVMRWSDNLCRLTCCSDPEHLCDYQEVTRCTLLLRVEQA